MIVAWTVLGLVTGFLVRAVLRAGGYGPGGDVGAGIAGALLGGLSFALLGSSGVTDFGFALLGGGVVDANLYSLLVAFLGACALVAILRLLAADLAT